jgi:hypothetical protein
MANGHREVLRIRFTASTSTSTTGCTSSTLEKDKNLHQIEAIFQQKPI